MLKVSVCICLNLNAAARDCHTIFCNLPQLLQTVFLVTKRKKSSFEDCLVRKGQLSSMLTFLGKKTIQSWVEALSEITCL